MTTILSKLIFRSQPVLLIAYVGLLLLLVLFVANPASSFANNRGWHMLLRLKLGATMVVPGEIQEQFERALQLDTSNNRALWGLSLLSMERGEYQEALAIWHRTEVEPQWLLTHGVMAEEASLWNEALYFYRGAERKLDGVAVGSGWQTGQMCQLYLFQPGTLTTDNRSYCEHYFQNQDGNLFLNGAFDQGLLGWRERYFSNPGDAAYRVSGDVGTPAPSAQLSGFSDAYHGGLFQRITLPAGTTLRYRARFQYSAADGDAFDLQALYVRGLGSIQVRESTPPQEIPLADGWTLIESVFVVPEPDLSEQKGNDLTFIFFPLRLTGQGSAWLDDVTLHIVEPDSLSGQLSP